MPSIEAPTYYEHSKGILPSRYDYFFKWMSDDALDTTGEVESPLGSVQLIELNDEHIAEFNRAHTDEYDVPPWRGWYVTRLDSDGIIWAMEYGSGTMAEEGARADFAEAEKVAAAWARAEDGEY